MVIVNNVFIQQNSLIFNKPKGGKGDNKQEVFVSKALNETLKLGDESLRNLWNTFIEESAMYGEDSYIYDFQDKEDICDLINGMTQREYEFLLKTLGGKRYFQVVWKLGGSNTINVIDLKGTISAYWGDIITRVMNYPSCYEVLKSFKEGEEKCFYYEQVICPILCERVGVEFIRK